jgi:hypothetical protein
MHPRPIPRAAPDPVHLYEQHQTYLALAAGFVTRYEASREPRLDQAALVIALHQAYATATEKITRRFRDDLDRGTHKAPRRRPRTKALFGDLQIP